MVRSADTLGNCCWPNQAWLGSQGRCVGAPSCPTGFSVSGESCVDDRARRLAEAEAALQTWQVGMVNRELTICNTSAAAFFLEYFGVVGVSAKRTPISRWHEPNSEENANDNDRGWNLAPGECTNTGRQGIAVVVRVERGERWSYFLLNPGTEGKANINWE